MLCRSGALLRESVVVGRLNLRGRVARSVGASARGARQGDSRAPGSTLGEPEGSSLAVVTALMWQWEEVAMSTLLEQRWQLV